MFASAKALLALGESDQFILDYLLQMADSEAQARRVLTLAKRATQ